MPRSSVVIGVGGTGVAVLSWVKKNLLETYGSMDDIPVRLLLIDVVEPDSKPGRAGVTTDNGADSLNDYGADVFRTQYLDPQHDIDLEREFVQLARDVRGQDIEAIKRGIESGKPEFSHFNWYCNGLFPNSLELNLRDGAGQLRQLGRLALLQGFHLRGNGDVLYSRLQNLILEAGRNTRDLDIHIVGSFAGGTGAGIFMDVAWLARKLVEEADMAAFITGFFAMPEALANIGNESMAVKSFNAWRELNRMLLVRRERGNDFELVWGSEGRARVHQVEKPVFDHVYLAAEPVEDRYRRPQESLFPMMGEAISFFLDKEAGNAYVQRIRQNLDAAKISARYLNRPTYSAFYVRSWKLPIHNSRLHRRHAIAEKLLNRILQVRLVDASADVRPQPEAEGPADGGNAGARRGQFQVADLVKLVQLQDDQCQDRVNDILTGDMTLQGIGNTLFITRQNEWRTVTPNRRNEEIQHWVQQNLYDLFVTLPDNEQGKALRFALDETVSFALQDMPDTRDKEILQRYVRDLHEQIYGNAANTGKYQELYGDFVGEQQRGKVYAILDGVQKFNFNVFRDRLSNWTTYILNHRPNGVGLGCVLSALEKLRFDLNANLKLLEEISDEIPAIDVMRAECQSLYTAVIDDHSRGFLGTPLFNNMRKIVEQWYEAEDDHLRTMQNRRAIQRMVETQRAMLTFVEDEALVKARAIEAKLVAGSRPQNIRSVYERIYTSIVLEDKRSEADRVSQGVVDVLDMRQVADTDEDRAINEVLEHVHWHIRPDLTIELVFELPEQQPVYITSSVGEEGRRDVQRFTTQLINQVAERAIRVADQNALDLLMPQLSAHLREASDVDHLLYRPAQGLGQPQQAVRTFYVQCDTSPEQQQQVEKLLDELDIPRDVTSNNTRAVVGTENRSKVVMFHALELLHPEDFSNWSINRERYWQRILGTNREQADFTYVRCDHILSGEQNALELEQRFWTDERYRDLRGLDKVQPILDSRLVHILEYKPRFTNFLRAWVLGWVQERRGARPAWLLEVPGRGSSTVYELDERSRNSDIVATITRFVFRTMDRVNRQYSHGDIVSRLDGVYENDWYTGDERSKELLARFLHERHMAVELFNLVKSPDSIVDYQAIEQEKRSLLAQAHENHYIPSLYMPEEPHISLAEIVLDDLVAKASMEASYLHMLQIVLPVVFDELIVEIEDFRKRNRWG